jgi:Fur family iron response transcriptional regulator
MASITNSSQNNSRPYTFTLNQLRKVGLRPTRQRLALAKLLFKDGNNRHVTAEDLHSEARREGIGVSLATVYNTLHQFTQKGLLREVIVESSRTYFCTNTSDHGHFFYEKSGRLLDIPADSIEISRIPPTPDGAEIKDIDIIIRIDS